MGAEPSSRAAPEAILDPTGAQVHLILGFSTALIDTELHGWFSATGAMDVIAPL